MPTQIPFGRACCDLSQAAFHLSRLKLPLSVKSVSDTSGGFGCIHNRTQKMAHRHPTFPVACLCLFYGNREGLLVVHVGSRGDGFWVRDRTVYLLSLRESALCIPPSRSLSLSVDEACVKVRLSIRRMSLGIGRWGNCVQRQSFQPHARRHCTARTARYGRTSGAHGLNINPAERQTHRKGPWVFDSGKRIRLCYAGEEYCHSRRRITGKTQ